MKYYQELTLLSHLEISSHFIWSKLYAQLHLALVEKQNQQGNILVGVSFPEYAQGEKRILLGNKLRLFAADETTLVQLDLSKWLTRLNDYVNCTSIRSVPNRVDTYAIYQRYHAQANINHLARRYAKRHNLSSEEALAHYANFKQKFSNLPFIRLKSLTNSHEFNLFIEKKTANQMINKGFGTYGLSSVSSVPEF